MLVPARLIYSRQTSFRALLRFITGTLLISSTYWTMVGPTFPASSEGVYGMDGE